MKTLFYAGRNRENLRGVSCKIWKIKREGRVVETRWGPVKIVQGRFRHSKTLARKRWPAFKTIIAAKEFYSAKVREKQLKGYELKPRASSFRR